MITLFSAEETRNADVYALNKLGIPSIVLMENAARSVYEIMLKYSDYFVNKNIGIICGKGNNGGDGFALARHLLINGFYVNIVSIGKESELKGDALTNYLIIKNILTEKITCKLTHFQTINDLKTFKNCSVIIDSVLGTGSKGKLSEPLAEIIKYINSLNAFKIAIDLPTGLELETSSGVEIFQADLTITLSELKTGLFFGKGYVYSGIVEKGSIGIGHDYYDKLITSAYLIEPEDALRGLPVKKKDSQKYSAGKVLVIAGSGQYPGAACFTANAVLKSGAGACFLAFPKSVKHVAQKKLDAAITFPYEDNKTEMLRELNFDELKPKLEWADVIVIGPGLGREKSALASARKIISSFKNKYFVIDADAIYTLTNEVYKKINLKKKTLTPHHKEFADLIGISLQELESNIPFYGKRFAVENKCLLVLKGAPSIIFTQKGKMLINSAGNPGMAKFGTGDALTGIIAAFAAQSKEVENSLIAAVYLHSLSADLLVETKTEYSFTATDIIENLPNAIKFIRNSLI
ncbi:MAG: Carbohydrate kinase family protein [Ignavibacteria bacterium]|nr:MAG: Carbohydrate kinase family protein [Ignavibacteria bacterium]KAF0160929.1 MAG: Carbohydrate kinase family protein [Ignavibacteria bacterium]